MRWSDSSPMALVLVVGSILSVVVGCGSDSPEPPMWKDQVLVDGLTYRGGLRATGPAFLVVVSVTNETISSRSITFPDSCIVRIQALRHLEKVWDQGETDPCDGREVTVVLAPGEERRFENEVPGTTLLMNLPDGTYRLSLYLRPVGSDEIELDLGDLSLSRRSQEGGPHGEEDAEEGN